MAMCQSCTERVIYMIDTTDKLGRLFSFVDVFESEEAITPATAELMRSDLQWVCIPVREYEERQEQRIKEREESDNE